MGLARVLSHLEAQEVLTSPSEPAARVPQVSHQKIAAQVLLVIPPFYELAMQGWHTRAPLSSQYPWALRGVRSVVCPSNLLTCSCTAPMDHRARTET